MTSPLSLSTGPSRQELFPHLRKPSTRNSSRTQSRLKATTLSLAFPLRKSISLNKISHVTTAQLSHSCGLDIATICRATNIGWADLIHPPVPIAEQATRLSTTSSTANLVKQNSQSSISGADLFELHNTSPVTCPSISLLLLLLPGQLFGLLRSPLRRILGGNNNNF